MTSEEDTVKMSPKKENDWKNNLSKSTGGALGFGLGLIGLLHPMGIALLILVLLLRCKLSWAVISGLLGWGCSLIYDPSSVGWFILELETLQSVWTFFYNTPLLAISGFNETKVMGGLFLGLASIPLLFLVNTFLIRSSSDLTSNEEVTP
jgi:uncharacterized protein (TIGR03546 family)